MHYCPDCGEGCHCSGDIDDTVVKTEEWVMENCQHLCEPEDEYDDCDDEDWDYDDYDYDDPEDDEDDEP